VAVGAALVVGAEAPPLCAPPDEAGLVELALASPELAGAPLSSHPETKAHVVTIESNDNILVHIESSSRVGPRSVRQDGARR